MIYEARKARIANTMITIAAYLIAASTSFRTSLVGPLHSRCAMRPNMGRGHTASCSPGCGGLDAPKDGSHDLLLDGGVKSWAENGPVPSQPPKTARADTGSPLKPNRA
jgi:hypothetical protein